MESALGLVVMTDELRLGELRIVRCTSDIKEQKLTIFVSVLPSGHGSYEYAS